MQALKNFYHKIQALISNIYYGFPSRGLTIIGVTGSDGKTTTVSMIYHILKNSGLKTGMISTVGAKIEEQELDTGFHVTSPDPWMLPKYLKLMKDRGIKYVVLETTSNGLDQNRFAYVNFDSAVVTNIKYDHLDYHKTWENYARAKFILIKKVKGNGLVVLNKDDEKAAKWIEKRSHTIKQDLFVKWCSKEELSGMQMTADGIAFDYEGHHFVIPVIGEHNFENAMQSISLTSKYVEINAIKDALTSFNTPKGRMQIMQSRPFTVIVDFAHTPAALEKALKSVIRIKPFESSRIISVFGCAAQRDKGRRKMGEVSAKYADITILTAEDPRDEELGIINNEILKHGEKEGAVLVDRFANRKLYNGAPIKALREKMDIVLRNKDKPFFLFDENTPRSREDAIDLALKVARPGDIVFITGKGHELSLAFGDPPKEYPWSDQECVNRKLIEMASEA